MNQNIIFGLLIVFLILIIILLILLLIFPKETKSLGIGLGICSIITIIIGGLYTKNIDNNSCACGKGECKKCGGIDRSFISIDTKQLIKNLINILSKNNRNNQDNTQLLQLYTNLGWTNVCQNPFLQQPSNEFMTNILYLEDYADLKPTNISLNIKLSIPTVDEYISKLSNDLNPELNIIQNYSNYVTDTSNDTTYQTNIPDKINYNYFTLNIGIEEDLIRFINNNDKLKNLLNMFLDSETDQTLNDIGEDLVNTKFLEDNSEFFRLKQGMTYYDDNSKPFISKFINIIKRNIIKQILDNSMILNLMKLIRRNINNDYFFLYITPIIAHRPSKTDLKNYLVTISEVFPEFNQFELLGITNHKGNLGDPNLQNSGGHYTSIVIRINDNNEKVIWICDDISGNKIVKNILSDKNINMLHIDEITHFNTLLFKKKTKNYIKGEPIRLYNDRNSCYVASALQLLLATDLLDDNDKVKPKEQSEEVQNLISQLQTELVPQLQQLKNDISKKQDITNKDNFYNKFNINKDTGKNYFIDNWGNIHDINMQLYNINNRIDENIERIQNINILIKDDSVEKELSYLNYLYNTINSKYIESMANDIELQHTRFILLNELNILTINISNFENEYNTQKTSLTQEINTEIYNQIAKIKTDILTSMDYIKTNTQDEINKINIGQINEELKSVKETFVNNFSPTPAPGPVPAKPTTTPAPGPTPTPAKPTTTPAPGPTPTPAKPPVPAKPTPPAKSTPTPAKLPTPGSPAKPTPPVPTPPAKPTPTPAKPTTTPAPGPGISSLPVYEFSSGEIEEAWEKELSSSKPKKIENNNTSFDNYLNKLLKENV